MTSQEDYVGGLTGYSSAAITNGSNSGAVTGRDDVGGLAGYSSSSITNGSNGGAVTGRNDVGGLVGSNYGSISGSSATGKVTGSTNIGALTGNNYGTITNSQGASASVTAAGLVSWEYELADGIAFTYTQVRWIEKPATGAPNWGNADTYLTYDANATSYQITGLDAGKEYAVRLFLGLNENGTFRLVKTTPVEFTTADSN